MPVSLFVARVAQGYEVIFHCTASSCQRQYVVHCSVSHAPHAHTTATTTVAITSQHPLTNEFPLTSLLTIGVADDAYYTSPTGSEIWFAEARHFSTKELCSAMKASMS